MFFLIPFAFAVSYEVWWYSIVIGIVFIISSIFHFYKEQKLVFIDISSSTILMASNLILLFKGHLVLPYTAIALLCAVIALFFYFRQFEKGYNLNHGLWHVFSAGVSFFCVATFLSYMQIIQSWPLTISMINPVKNARPKASFQLNGIISGNNRCATKTTIIAIGNQNSKDTSIFINPIQ